MAVKEIKITGTEQSLKVRMMEGTRGLSFSYGVEVQLEEGGEKFTNWTPVAVYTRDHEWEIQSALNNEQGHEIVNEFRATFEQEIVAWQVAEAAQTLEPNGSLTVAHLEFLFGKVAPVEMS